MLRTGAVADARPDVSIRTRPFGRVMPLAVAPLAHRRGVSIRTRPFGRVMQRVQRPYPPADVFQSAPGLSAG